MSMGYSRVKNRIPSRFTTPVEATLNCMGVTATPDFLSFLFGGDGEEPVFKLIDFDYTPADKDDKDSKTEFNLAFELTLPEKYRTIPNTQIGMLENYILSCIFLVEGNSIFLKSKIWHDTA